MTLLRMSLIGAGMILTIVLLRLLLQQRVHRNVFLALWLIAALRLLVPVFIPTGLEVALPPQSEQSFAAAAVRTMVQPTQPAASGSTLWRVLPWVWLAVAVGLLLFFSLSHLRLRRTFRFSVPMPEEAGLPANVRMLDGLGSPLTYGVFRPVILLPASFDWRDRQRLTQVLLHENAHIRYRDVPVKALLVLACCLHWFNPAVWLMLVLASQDMEMRCDAAVVRALGRGGKLCYARTLVETECGRRSGGVLQTGFSFNSTARRLKTLAKAKVQPLTSILLAVVTVAMASVCFLTVNAAGEKADLPTHTPSLTTRQRVQPEKQELPARQPVRQEVSTEPQQASTEELSFAYAPTEPTPTELPEPTETTEQTEPTEPTEPQLPVLQVSGVPSVVAPGTVFYVTISGSATAHLVSDLPAALAIQSCTVQADGALVYTLCAYSAGTANLYCDGGAGGVFVGAVTVQPTVQQEEQKPWFMGEDYQPQLDIDTSNGPAGDFSWLLDGEDAP